VHPSTKDSDIGVAELSDHQLRRVAGHTGMGEAWDIRVIDARTVDLVSKGAKTRAKNQGDVDGVDLDFAADQPNGI
jgi:hypothetical protein